MYLRSISDVREAQERFGDWDLQPSIVGPGIPLRYVVGKIVPKAWFGRGALETENSVWLNMLPTSDDRPRTIRLY